MVEQTTISKKKEFSDNVERLWGASKKKKVKRSLGEG